MTYFRCEKITCRNARVPPLAPSAAIMVRPWLLLTSHPFPPTRRGSFSFSAIYFMVRQSGLISTFSSPSPFWWPSHRSSHVFFSSTKFSPNLRAHFLRYKLASILAAWWSAPVVPGFTLYILVRLCTLIPYQGINLKNQEGNTNRLLMNKFVREHFSAIKINFS